MAELEKTIEELKAEIAELRRTIKEMAAALVILTQKDEDAREFAARIEEISRWDEETIKEMAAWDEAVEAEKN